MSRFLYAVEADTARFVGRLITLAPETCEDEIQRLTARLYREIGDDYVIYDSKNRPEFLPRHIPPAARKRGPEEKIGRQSILRYFRKASGSQREHRASAEHLDRIN